VLHIFPYLPTLLVDEAPLSVRLLHAHLSVIGFVNVDRAEDALAAAQMIARHPYNLVFVTLEMSEINELEYIKHLRTHPKTRSALIVAMGGDQCALRQTEAIRAGADAFLDRPTTPDLLERMLASLLSSRAAWKSKIVPIPLNKRRAEGKFQSINSKPICDY
jgi:two-component system, chemotaxis family, chemotaxis protein CheY